MNHELVAAEKSKCKKHTRLYAAKGGVTLNNEAPVLNVDFGGSSVQCRRARDWLIAPLLAGGGALSQ